MCISDDAWQGTKEQAKLYKRCLDDAGDLELRLASSTGALNEARKELTAKDTQLRACQLERISAEVKASKADHTFPLWLRVSLDVVSVALGSAAGACAGLSCSTELTVGLSVAALSVVGLRIALEFD